MNLSLEVLLLKMRRIKTKEENEAEYLKAPQDRRFYQMFALALYSVGLITSQSWTWFKKPKNKYLILQRYIMIFMEPLSTWSQMVFFFMNHKEYAFGEQTVMLSIIPISCNIMVKLITAQTKIYENCLKDFMYKLHLHNLYLKDPADKYVKECLIAAERYSRITFYTLMTICYMCATAWLAVPIRHSIMNNPDVNNITVKMEVVIHIWLPFDYEYNFKNWLMVQGVATFCTFIGVSVMFLYDALMLSCLYHFIMHIKVFSNKLKTSFLAGQSQNEIKLKLIELFLDYGFIIDILGTFEQCFGWYIVLIYVQNLFEGAVLLYTLTSGNLDMETLLTYGLMIPYLQGFLILSAYVLEYIRILTDEISILVYNLPWEDMSVSNQKMTWMLLFRVQPTMEFKAAFNTKTGVQPALNIIKTTFSYYVMIKARNDG